jgi:hypothetical protein
MNIIRKTSVLAAVMVGVFVGSARADEGMHVRVPYPFLVAGQVMPAGQYSFSTTPGGSLLIRGIGATKAAIFTHTVTLGSHDPAGNVPSVVLQRYENQFRLAQVWENGDSGFAPYSPVSNAPRLASAETVILTSGE